jgi:hypothetical protein
MNNQPASPQSAFYWKTGAPSVFRPFKTSEKISRANTARVEKARAEGTADWTTVVGVSNRSDGILKVQRYSAPVEGAAAGQRAADKRAALRRDGL